MNRNSVPLFMLPGNMNLLLDGEIECQGVSMKRDPGSGEGVVLMFNFTAEQREAAHAKGFKTTNGTGEK